MSEEKTPPRTNFAELVEGILGPRLDRFEREACAMIGAQLSKLGADIAQQVCNALGAWRHSVDADRESTKLKLAEIDERFESFERRLEALERAHRCDTDVPPPL